MSKYVGFKAGKLHESHVISEYYCGGCGYPLTDHDSFCPECGGALRECDVDTLAAENAKLREAAERDADVMEALNLSLEESQAENAKLRELVRKWYPHMARRVGKDALAQWGQLDVLRELGIEVDG